ncbi:alpha/beta fold hydrolase [Mycolicibacterium vanbaalenii]|jgi:2-hydroxy-6-oxonona-2,4-dienedioate hydrolase|uniref:Alpha/beta hydrolase fold protein n=1 Tax=Mycolicibacterium vanbaalenii (strain DSM 7251 / JCM 13017 / BCRC 16820 / KCTC 9966 / NRRL B-24157 / PYR-1) TaxID=350058 RepID=A1TDE0_MYCVP|nr:alpha/beta hydrolase [Mycolicibacterium vanbaalenii]ABM15190.1 alpha/beta hydrolase fold protein [Mycolicibacterium vanbaalenii PYR-1]MCV7127070.1 alpha/beta fold hydrolase [Mycolicibacterium vanbaalenii PYR-1]
MSSEITEQYTSRDIETKSGTIHYNEAGEGYPIVMLHGSGPGATGWSNFGSNIKGLADRFRVIAADMPGWGQSEAVKPDARDHVAAALQLLDGLGIEKAAFVGNSMGGGTAIQFAVAHPDRISHLITMGSRAPGPTIIGPDGLTEGLKTLLKGYTDPSPTSMRELVEIMTYDSANATDELVQQRYAAAIGRPDHLENFMIAGLLGIPQATVEEIAGIETPTLIFHGKDDRVVSYEAALKLVSLIRDSRVVLINRCGHWLQTEHSDEFNRLVADFVSNR